jgi:hypothetical protein
MTTSHTPAPKAVEALPELPELPPIIPHWVGCVPPRYTIEQMRQYAYASVRAALAAAQAEQANPWHDAVLAECMSIETAYAEADPVGTVKRLIDWHVETALQEVAAGLSTLSPQPPSPDVERQAVAWEDEGVGSKECGPSDPDPADIIAGALQTSRSHAYELMEQAIAESGRSATPPQEAGDADAEDAARYRWLARKVSAHGVIDGWAFGFPTHLSLPAPVLAMRDPEAALGQAIDAARSPQQEPKA